MEELTEASIRVQIRRTGTLIWSFCAVSLLFAVGSAAIAFTSTGLTAGIMCFIAAVGAFLSYHLAGWALRFARDAKEALQSLARYRGDLSGFERNYGYLMHLRKTEIL
jgi:hypothetical protein